jgi:5'-methylthioadenosine phosphorylase
MQAEIGIIGGTGLYDPNLLKNSVETTISTPYGAPSDSVTIGKLHGRIVAFLPRHAKKHTIRPTDINARANIFAMKKLGVKRILAPSTVGSLKEEYKPGDIVFVDQFIDRTTRREQSFYTAAEKKVCHISVAEPMCQELRQSLKEAADVLKLKVHESGTYVCIEGPRYSTKAESKMFRAWGADVVGMTLVPECVLAREAEICYATIAAVTDYDVWKEEPVSAEKVVKTMRANVEKVRKLVVETVIRIPTKRACECGRALSKALM